MKAKLIIILILPILIFAQSKPYTTDLLFKTKSVVEAVISPDGKYAALVVALPRTLEEGPGSDYREIHLYNFSTNQTEEILSGSTGGSSLSWSNDSKKFYFLSRYGGLKTTQLFSMHITDGDPIQITDWNKSIRAYNINSNETLIAFTAEEIRNPEREKFTARGFDAEFYEEEYNDITLYVQNISTKEVKKLTSNKTVHSFLFSPDGKKIAAQISDKNLVDDSYMFKQIYFIDVSSGEMKQIVNSPGKLGNMSFSPDGNHIAFIGGADRYDAVSGSLFIAPVNKLSEYSSLINYTRNYFLSATDVVWVNNKTVVLAADEGVYNTLSTFQIGSDKRTILLDTGFIVMGKPEINKNLIVFPGSTPNHPNELFTFDITTKKLLKKTNYNSWLEEHKLTPQLRITYKAKDGWLIEGILVYPKNYQAGKKYPLITYIHGGPESCVLNGWLNGYGSWGQFAAEKGFFVFYPNYRASSGRGVDFSMAGRGDLVGKEFEDVIDGIDYLIELGLVDANKVGIGGGSYGGYFSAWGATKYSHRFNAAVVFVGVSNQISKAHTTDIPYEDYYVHWGIWPYEDFQRYLDASPVAFAQNSKTPTLILHGKEDPRVHPAQSLELYRTLKLHGKAPVRFVMYPGEGHGNRKNTSRYDYLVRTLQWFEYYLNSDNPKDKMPDMYEIE